MRNPAEDPRIARAVRLIAKALQHLSPIEREAAMRAAATAHRVSVVSGHPGRLPELLIDDPILSTRAKHCLLNAGIETVTQLSALNKCQVLALKNFGRKSLKEANEVLRDHGKAFVGTEDLPTGVA